MDVISGHHERLLCWHVWVGVLAWVIYYDTHRNFTTTMAYSGSYHT